MVHTSDLYTKRRPSTRFSVVLWFGLCVLGCVWVVLNGEKGLRGRPKRCRSNPQDGDSAQCTAFLEKSSAAPGPAKRLTTDTRGCTCRWDGAGGAREEVERSAVERGSERGAGKAIHLSLFSKPHTAYVQGGGFSSQSRSPLPRVTHAAVHSPTSRFVAGIGPLAGVSTGLNYISLRLLFSCGYEYGGGNVEGTHMCERKHKERTKRRSKHVLVRFLFRNRGVPAASLSSIACLVTKDQHRLPNISFSSL